MTDFSPVLEEPLSSAAQPNMSTLISGIVSDVRDLLFSGDQGIRLRNSSTEWFAPAIKEIR